MALCRTYVKCPHCASRYSGPDDESHQKGCPRPLERQLEQLRWSQNTQTCPICTAEAHINDGDCYECTGCHAHWVPSWTQGTDAIRKSTVIFRMDGGPMPMTQLPGTGSGIFPRRDEIARLTAELAEMKEKFKKEGV